MGCVEFFTGYIFPWLRDAAGAAGSFLSSQTVERARNLIDLGKNADKLAVEMRRLSEIRDDLLRQVEFEELRPRMKRSRRVAGWIERVDELEDTVGAFRDSFGRRRTFAETCSPSSVYSNYELGQTAVDRLRQVSELENERDRLQGGDLVFEAPPDAVVPVASSATTTIVGEGRVLTDLRRYLLSDDAVGVVGIYGMGGVGKTTYLTMVNNEFLEEARRGDFDVVIWVTVSQNAQISRLQEDIGVRLGFSRTGNSAALPTNSIDRRDTLYEALSQKRFLLLLDDVWEELKLNEIGIPRPPENRSKAKVVFTTRLKEVCVKMGAHELINVAVLDMEESWELFNLKLGSVPDLSSGVGSSSSGLLPLARTVVKRCGGLPLALVTVARAMSGAETVDEWEDAAVKLRVSPEQVPDMEKEVLSVLKFSFDKLKDDSMRHCLLYCCLFPEDDDIDIELLIEYCVGEGFLDTTTKQYSPSLDGARRKGRGVVKGLKDACLLESAGTSRDGSVERVKMHDVVRDMALWLTNGEEDVGRETSDYFMVVDHRGGDEASILSRRVDRWEKAKRISFLPLFNRWNIELNIGNIELPSRVPNCPNLQTLLLRRGGDIVKQLIVGSGGFLLKFMPALRVLDLLNTDIEELPEEIGLLVGLQYLNLQGTEITSLPRELGNLVKLRQLNVSDTKRLERIPRGAILGLEALQTLNIFESKYRVTWDDEGDDGDGAQVTLSGMERSLEQLEELGITIMTSAGSADLEKLMDSKMLSRSTRFLRLVGASDLSASVLAKVLEKLNGLRELTLSNFPELEEVRFPQFQHLEVLKLWYLDQARILVPSLPCCPFQRLYRLVIIDCHGFEDLTWIQHLPRLAWVSLYKCHGLEVLLAGGDQPEGGKVEDSFFPRLKRLYLTHLPRLRAISDRPLLLPSLEDIVVRGCPRLERLALGRGSAKMLQMISGTQEWWDGLHWGQDGAVKDIFLDRFKASGWMQ